MMNKGSVLENIKNTGQEKTLKRKADKQDAQRADGTLNILNKQLVSTSTENQYVTFKIGAEEYGVDIMLVQEIIRYRQPTTVYNSDPVIRGVTNFRGRVIPFIDTHRKFNLPEAEYDEFTVVIVIELAGKTMGMIVDRVSDIMSFNPEDIQLVDSEFARHIQTEHLKGMAKSEDRIIMLLDPRRLISVDELADIDTDIDGDINTDIDGVNPEL